MRNSQRLKFSFCGIALMMSACSAKVETADGQGIPTFPTIPTPQQQQQPQAGSQSIYGKIFSGELGTIQMQLGDASIVQIARTCAIGSAQCASIGMLESEYLELKLNDARSVKKDTLDNGNKVETSIAGDTSKITLTSKVKSSNGYDLYQVIHKMSYSSNPCGNSNREGLEDKMTIQSDGDSSDSCTALFN